MPSFVRYLQIIVSASQAVDFCQKSGKVEKSFSYKKGKSHDCLGQEVSDVIIMNYRRDFQHSPVVVAPGELLLHIPTGLQAGQGLDHLTEQNCENCTHTHFQINFTIHVSEGRQQGFGFMRIKR